MANLSSTQKEEEDRIALRRFAMTTFFWGSVLQWLSMSINWALFAYLQFKFTLLDVYSRAVGMDFVDYVRINNFSELFLGFLAGSAFYALIIFRVAKSAPLRLIERKRSLFQVAAVLAIFPSIVATFSCLVAFLAARGMLDRMFKGDQFIETFLPAAMFYFIPGVVTGMLAGLLVRQKAIAQQEQRRQEMRQDWDLDIHQRT
ncbi:MAG: hypothetical protein RLZZ519_920 [Bacteroidota bacterium]|jgi:hypothetical protein